LAFGSRSTSSGTVVLYLVILLYVFPSPTQKPTTKMGSTLLPQAKGRQISQQRKFSNKERETSCAAGIQYC
jgi:hypothetical protein